MNVKDFAFGNFIDKHKVSAVVRSDKVAGLNVCPVGDRSGIGRGGEQVGRQTAGAGFTFGSNQVGLNRLVIFKSVEEVGQMVGQAGTVNADMMFFLKVIKLLLV